MKSLLNLTVLLGLGLAAGAQAKTFTVKVPKGHHVVTVSETRYHTGCSGTENYNSVLLVKENTYVAGNDIKVDDLQEYLARFKRAIQPDPRRPQLCQAEVPHVSITQFPVSAWLKATTVKVTTPDLPNSGGPVEDEVTVTEVKGPGVD